MWTGPPICVAALTTFAVESFRFALSCSAITSAAISDHSRFVLELVEQLGDGFHLDAGLALFGLGDFQDLETRRDIDAVICRRLLVDRLLLRLHDVRQRRV